MLEEDLGEGQVTLPISFFDNVVEVSHRLVGMDYESKEDFIQGQIPSTAQSPYVPTGSADSIGESAVTANSRRACRRKGRTSQISARATMASTLIRIR